MSFFFLLSSSFQESSTVIYRRKYPSGLKSMYEDGENGVLKKAGPDTVRNSQFPSHDLEFSECSAISTVNLHQITCCFHETSPDDKEDEGTHSKLFNFYILFIFRRQITN